MRATYDRCRAVDGGVEDVEKSADEPKPEMKMSPVPSRTIWTPLSVSPPVPPVNVDQTRPGDDQRQRRVALGNLEAVAMLVDDAEPAGDRPRSTARQHFGG